MVGQQHFWVTVECVSAGQKDGKQSGQEEDTRVGRQLDGEKTESEGVHLIAAAVCFHLGSHVFS